MINIEDVRHKLTTFVTSIKTIFDRRFKLSKKKMTVKPWFLAAGGSILIIGGYFLFYFNTTSVVYQLIIDQEQVGVVASTEKGDTLIQSALDNLSKSVGQPVKMSNQVEYQQIRLKNSEIDELESSDINSYLDVYVEGAELTIDGQKIATLGCMEDAHAVLAAIKQQYAVSSDNNKIESVSFVEDVQVQPVEISPKEIDSAAAIIEQLQEGKVARHEYTVQPNDSLWLIARKHDIKTMDLIANNPGYNEDSVLQIGDKLDIVKVDPYLTVVSKGVRTVTETIPFDVQTKTDTRLGSGQSRITQYGSDGEKKVTFSYVEKNGKIVEKQIIDEVVIKEPVTQVVAKGPYRAAVAAGYSRGSGKVPGISWPLSGRINSYYGYRWGGFHTGIDINGDKGDPYTAVYGGTVTLADWQGSYGLCILIDHGNGVMTRYAHSSKLLVSKGDQVTKGQTIGLVGSTGRSTGPHLHFEIIVNGDTVNPLSYLP